MKLILFCFFFVDPSLLYFNYFPRENTFEHENCAVNIFLLHSSHFRKLKIHCNLREMRFVAACKLRKMHYVIFGESIYFICTISPSSACTYANNH